MAVPATGGTITANTGNFTETFPAGAFSSTADVVLDDIPQSSLPAPLLRARFEHRDGTPYPDAAARNPAAGPK